MADPLRIVIDDDTESVTVDPDTGTVEERQADGGVLVRLDAKQPSADAQEDKWYRNLADDLDQQQLSVIANELVDAIEADNKSRQESLENHVRGLEMLGLKLEKPSSGVGDNVEGMSRVTNPLLLEAVLKAWANAQAELLPANGPCKIKDDGMETKGEDELAEALERGMNHYLTKTAREYYPDTSHMLLWGTCFKGAGFKKIYRCPMRRRPVSESVDAKDLILSDTAKDLSSCGRITHEIPMRPSVMKRMKLLGAYRDVTDHQPTPTINPVDQQIALIQGTQAKPDRPEDQPYTIWETQCELDLPKFAPGQFRNEGIPIPYLVTIDKDSREVLSICRDWDEDDEECARQVMYVRYPYIPGPGVYCTGLLNVLGNCSAAMTAAWREALDCGMFANFPAGLIAKLGGRQLTSTIRLAPGEFEPIETSGMPINQIAMGLPFKDVTPGLLALIDKVTEQARTLGGTAELPAGEGLQNVPVGTMLAQIEQATKTMAAAHKGMHQAQSEELGLIIDLFRRHPKDFWKSNKECPKDYWNEQKLLQALDACQLIPVSDPNVPSHIHRVAKALGLVQLMGIPQFAPRLDPDEALRRVLAAMREDPIGLVVQPPPGNAQPSPEEQAKLMTANANMIKANAAVGKAQADAQTGEAGHTLKQAELASQEKIKTADITKELIIHAADQDKIASAEKREAMALQAKTMENARAHELDQHRQGLELVKQGVAAEHEDRKHAFETTKHANEHALEMAKAQRQHGVESAKFGLAAQQHEHDKNIGIAAHAVEAQSQAVEAAAKIHSALNPPKPAAAKPKPKPKKR